MLELGLKVLLSYLVGSLTGALIVGKLAGGIDIRTQGSGNAGGTNALRTQGKWFALRVILIDIGKGFLPPWLFPVLVLPGVPLDPELSRTWLMLACAGASVIGHCYPVWFGFAGGKGAATAIGALLGIAPELEPRPDHASYLQSWLSVLANDKRAIFQAAAHAQRAVSFLHSLQPEADLRAAA